MGKISGLEDLRMQVHSLRGGGGHSNHSEEQTEDITRRRRVGASLIHTGLQTLKKLYPYHQEVMGETFEVQVYLSNNAGKKKTVKLVHCHVTAITSEIPTRG